MNKPHIYDQKLVVQIKSWIVGLEPSEARKLISKKLGIKYRAAADVYSKYIDKEAKRIKSAENIYEAEVVATEASSLEDVVKLCGVDDKTWNVKSFTVFKKESGGATWRVSFEKNFDLSQRDKDLTEVFREKAGKYAPKKWIQETCKGKKDCIYVLNIQDLHLQKLTWAKQTGSDYDIKIAKKVFSDAVQDLMGKVAIDRVEKVVVIIGSDFFHTDTAQGTTFGGTHVDTDSRWEKAFSEGCELMVDTISKISQKTRVMGVVVVGNHDKTRAHYLGAYLTAWFRNNNRVEIDARPTSRKYVPFGKTLIGFTHGSEEKIKDLPMIAMRENQATISNHKYIEFLTGHKHTDKVEEMMGIKVRTAPSLCATDGWHNEKGYIGNIRTSQGLLYSKDYGLEAIYYSRPVED